MLLLNHIINNYHLLLNLFLFFTSTKQIYAHRLLPSSTSTKQQQQQQVQQRKRKRASNWNQIQNLLKDKLYTDDVGYGFSVTNSIDGKIVAVGAPFDNSSKGRVSIYTFDTKKQSWLSMGLDIVGLQHYDQFGQSVTLSHSGQILAISAPKALDGRGYVTIYRYDSTTLSWEQIGERIEGQLSQENFGFSIALSGKGGMVAIGAPNGNGESGMVRVYKYDGTDSNHQWLQVGLNIVGESADDEAGHSVDILEEGMNVYVGIGAPL